MFPQPNHSPLLRALPLTAQHLMTNGHQIVMYYWELVQVPVGSAATLQPLVACRSPTLCQTAGDYIAWLTVTNDQGGVDNCQATLEAIPAQSLWVEMFWVNSGDDMDLHLIAPGVNWSSALESTNDCYYANCVYSFRLGPTRLRRMTQVWILMIFLRRTRKH